MSSVTISSIGSSSTEPFLRTFAFDAEITESFRIRSRTRSSCTMPIRELQMITPRNSMFLY